MDGKQELQTRTEHTRSLDDAEKYKAIDTLTRLGLLIPVSQLGTFHGRVSNKNEPPWSVDRAFTNHGNSTGNNNVNARSTLYTSEANVAEAFARARGSEIIEAHYIEIFRQKVINYSPEERRQWLDRINTKERDKWQSMDPVGRDYYERRNGKKGPVVYAEDYLNDQFVRGIEARGLEQRSPEEEKEAAWKKASEGFLAEVHEILTSDSDATILDLSFDYKKLSEQDQNIYFNALRALAIPITEGTPVDFHSQGSVEKFAQSMNKLQKNFVLSDEVAQIATAAGISEQVALQLASAYNSLQVARKKPSFLADRLLRYPSNIFTDKTTVNGQDEETPFNLEWAERYFHQAHIVGIKQVINSATLGNKVSSVSFFDLEKIGTRDQLASQRDDMQRKIGGLADKFQDFPKLETAGEAREFLERLADAHVKPEALVEAAKKVNGYTDILESDAGNWEGFTLAEHTETVLRNFDENFADIIPVAYLTPMRLIAVVHDLGKPIAVARNEKSKQKEYNAIQAGDFLDKIGINANFRDLILAVIGEGSNLAFQCQQRPGDETAFNKMKLFAQKTLQKYFNSTDVDDSQIAAFTEMCKILQLCDGGAYTSMAITRRNGKGRFRNAPSFNDSYDTPIGIGKRDIRYNQVKT